MTVQPFEATVGDAIVRSIASTGISHVFCVPGESYLGALDAFNDVSDPTVVATRHEEGAGFMADAMAKLTGKPGVAMVSRGPGLTHLLVAVHAARQDSTPLVVLVGQVPTDRIGRDAFQEVDIVSLGSMLGKGGLRMERPEDAFDVMQSALTQATSGRPGPVLVEVPEDVANSDLRVSFAGVMSDEARGVLAPEGSIRRAIQTIEQAENPVIIVGGGVLRSGAFEAVAELAGQLGVPVYTGWRRLDAFPNDHPCFAGALPWLSDEMKRPLFEADLIVGLGVRLDDQTTFHYQLPRESQQLIQIDVAPESFIGHPRALEMEADVASSVDQMLRLLESRPMDGERLARRRDRTGGLHRAYLSSLDPVPSPGASGGIRLAPAFAVLRDSLPDDAVLVSDAGAFAVYLNRYYQWKQPGTFVGSKSGTMGYAVPGAIGAKLAVGERVVVAVAGDGGFAMTMSELHTAARLGLSGLVCLVFDNALLGSIARNQSATYSVDRRIGVASGRSDFVKIAEGLGAAGWRADTLEEYASVLPEAIKADAPSVIQITAAPEDLDAWA